MMVVLGELAGRDEYSLVEALKQRKVRNRAMLACQCLPLLNSVMVWVMSSLFYGSSAAFHVTVPILWRHVSHKF
ncbi:hypothetical protein NC651_021366 [Populus alba x Populus x berolinensis]|nr:hypothetical protein NC651_021366 [Populus alba x Populus x berolinensis]